MRLVGTAASGLRAQQIAIDTIGNNLANANTLGFKANQRFSLRLCRQRCVLGIPKSTKIRVRSL